MTEATYNASVKTKAKPTTATVTGTTTAPAFPFPKFDFASFEFPKMEVPAAFREFAEKSVSQAKDNYEKMKTVAEEATDVIEETYANATKGAADYGLKLIEAGRVNTNAAFDFYSE